MTLRFFRDNLLTTFNGGRFQHDLFHCIKNSIQTMSDFPDLLEIDNNEMNAMCTYLTNLSKTTVSNKLYLIEFSVITTPF